MAIGNPINLTSNVESKNISVIATAGQTQFTITGGYRINQISVFRNGVRLVDGRDYTALDGSIVTLLSAAILGDTLDFQVFDDFRVSDALNVNTGGNVNGNVTVTGILSTTNLSVGSSISLDSTSGIVTATQFVGSVTGTISGTASTATNAEGLIGTPDITVNNIVAAGATFTGVVTYEDVTNIDSLGIVTARTGVDVTANGLVVNAGVSTFAADLSIADKIVHTGDTNTSIRFPSADTFTVETAGTKRFEVNSTGDVGLVGIATATGLVVVAGSGVYAGHAGVVTAVTFDGNLSGNVTGAATQVTVADESSDTTCFPLFATAATGNLPPKSGSNLTFNSSSGALTATSFVGAVTGNVTGDSAGTHTGAVDLNGGVLTLDADADTTITADTDDQIDIAFGGNDRITLSTGLIDLKNDGSQSQLRLYCEVSNAHYAALQAPAHSAFSGNITLTLPAATDTLVARTTTDTLTNKTLTSPTITSPTITIDDSITHTGDTNTKIRFPAADTFTVETAGSERLRIKSDGFIEVNGGTNTSGIQFKSNGTNVGYVAPAGVLGGSDSDLGIRVESGNNQIFYVAASEVLRITSDGKIRVPDSGKFTAGAGDDLSIYHDTSNSYIDNKGGDLYIQTSDTGDDIFIRAVDDITIQTAGDENAVVCTGDGSVALYYDNSKKLETTSGGCEVTGTLNATSNVTINGKGAATTGKAIAMAMVFG